MAKRVPFFLVLEAVLAGNGTGSVSYSVPPSEQLLLAEMVFVATGAFNITNIRTSDGLANTNATPAIEIPSTVMQNGANSNRGIKEFAEPLLVNGSITVYVDLEDSSGAGNTVTLVFNAIRIIPD